MMSEGCESALSEYCRQHASAFDGGTDENKLSYMPIFNGYVNLVQNLLSQQLEQHILDFKWQDLADLELQDLSHLCNCDTLEILVSAIDFQAFKEHILSFRSESLLADVMPAISPWQPASCR
jgi:The ARF-like 2 binding protein BART